MSVRNCGAWTLALSVGLTVAPAAADDDACIRAHQQGQEERLDGNLRAARKLLVSCAAASCPRVIVDDCNAWLQELAQEIPSVVVALEGPDAPSVLRVELDGSTIAISGQALEVDPGRHEVVVHLANRPPVRHEVVARQGERNRLVRIQLGSADVPSAVGGLTYSGIAFAGLGVVSMVTFAILGSMVRSEFDDLESTCPRCSRDDIDALQTKAVIADVALGVGIGGLVIGGVLIAVDVATGPGDPSDVVALRAGWRF